MSTEAWHVALAVAAAEVRRAAVLLLGGDPGQPGQAEGVMENDRGGREITTLPDYGTMTTGGGGNWAAALALLDRQSGPAE